MSNIKLSDLTVDFLFCEYEKYIKIKLKTESQKKYIKNYNNFIKPIFGTMLAKDVKHEQVVNWMLDIQNGNYSYKYKSSVFTTFSNILEYGVNFYNLKDNVVKKIGNFKKERNRVTESDFWTLDEFRSFISVVDDPLYKLFFYTLFFTGLRKGECCALTWEDFNGTHLDINKTISSSNVINSPKTHSSYRNIALDKELIEVFKKHYKQEKKKKGFKDSWYIFGGEKPLSATTINRRKNDYCSKASIKQIKIHGFRHSHATLLLSQGIPINIISKRLGHSSIAMTLDVYSHLIPQDEFRVTNLIDSFNQEERLI